MRLRTRIVLSILAVIILVGVILPTMISAKSDILVIGGIAILLFIPFILWDIGVKTYKLINGEKK
jgi:hypothetical protein